MPLFLSRDGNRLYNIPCPVACDSHECCPGTWVFDEVNHTQTQTDGGITVGDSVTSDTGKALVITGADTNGVPITADTDLGVITTDPNFVCTGSGIMTPNVLPGGFVYEAANVVDMSTAGTFRICARSSGSGVSVSTGTPGLAHSLDVSRAFFGVGFSTPIWNGAHFVQHALQEIPACFGGASICPTFNGPLDNTFPWHIAIAQSVEGNCYCVESSFEPCTNRWCLRVTVDDFDFTPGDTAGSFVFWGDIHMSPPTGGVASEVLLEYDGLNTLNISDDMGNSDSTNFTCDEFSLQFCYANPSTFNVNVLPIGDEISNITYSKGYACADGIMM